MELWNDFEGKTVDGRFQLDHLIGPKGRSAYFTTRDETGGPAVIRLIESLNDEEEILGRWRRVTGMKQQHLVEVLACGQTVLDGTHLVYAVMEPTDMELADALRDRALTTDETRQIALSVADGLEALHAKGLVHEHVDAENVLARGDLVKLRSDVVREAPEGSEAAALRARDVRDLSLLLAQCLTRVRRVGETRLPVPFDEAVRKGESGSWGLGAMIAALRPAGSPAVTRPAAAPGVAAPATSPSPAPAAARPQAPAAGTAAVAATPRAAGSAASLSPSSAPAASTSPSAASAPAASTISAAHTISSPAASTAPLSTAPAAVADRLANQAAGRGEGMAAHVRTPRAPDRIETGTGTEPRRIGLLVAVGAGLLLLVLLGLYFLRSSRSGGTRSVSQETPQAVAAPDQSSSDRPPAHDSASAPVPQHTAKPSPALGSGRSPTTAPEARAVTAGSAPSGSSQWRVVAFTYNRQDQATAKVQAIAAKHPGLKPEVFSPSGHAPYLVTLGGWMSASQATAFRGKARSDGMPRDVYAQNYRGGR